jgi:UDP-N-acetylglucosamine:LPS N-acetylglucosamine transferase
MKKLRVLLIMGSGGHTAEMLMLEQLLGDRFEYEYLINSEDQVTPGRIRGKIHKLQNPRPYKARWFSMVRDTLAGLFRSIELMRDFDAVISAGPGVTVPVFYAAKLVGKKTIFLESWSRVQSKSVSGRLCYPVADLFFVQWPELKKKYPNAIYAGRLG